MLYLAGEQAAFSHGVDNAGNFYAEVMGYDPAYKELGVGTYLTGEVLARLLGDGRDGFIDFGVGNSEAKRRFCDTFFRAADRFLVAPTPRLMALNTLRVASLSVHLALKKALSRGGLFHKVRSAWRYGQKWAAPEDRRANLTEWKQLRRNDELPTPGLGGSEKFTN